VSIKDKVIAKLLVNAKFVNREQLSEAVEAQELMADADGNRPRLFDVLLQKGYISREQLQTILEGYDRKTKRLFGEIAIQWNLLDETQLQECLDLQGTMKDGGQKVPRIGQLLVSRNYLKKHQVKAILEEQNKKIASCPGCGASFNVRSVEPGAKFKCTACGKALHFRKEKEAPIDADATMVREVEPLFREKPKQKERSSFGDFKILKHLGQDSTGSIYKARKENDERIVALKIFNKDIADDQEYVATLKANVQRSAKLSNEYLKKVYAMGTVNGAYYVSTEFIEGESLRNILQRKGMLSVKKALVICARVVEALIYVHEHGGIHEDVRPSNILISTDGRVVLSNLGLTPKITDNILSIVDSGQLAPFYIAPEQVVEDREVDYRADIYSLGATLYHLVAGRPPFEGQSPFEVLIRFTEDFFPPPQVYNPAVPQAVARIIEKMVAAEPEDRYQDLKELLHDLENPKEARYEGEVMPDESSEAMRALMSEDSGLQQLAQSPASSGSPMPLIGAAVLLLIGVVLWFTVFSKPDKDKADSPVFVSLQSAYRADGHRFERQQPLIARCKTFLKQAGDSKKQPQVQTWLDELKRRHADAKRSKVAHLKDEIDGAIRDRNYPRARSLLERETGKHTFDAWTEATAELDANITQAEKQFYEALLLASQRYEKVGKLVQAIKVFKDAERKFDNRAYHRKLKAERARLNDEIDKARVAALATETRRSLERAQNAITESRTFERDHKYKDVIGKLHNRVMKTLDPAHRPLLQARIQQLRLQQAMFEHVGRVQIRNYPGLSCIYNKKRYPIAQLKQDGLWLKGENNYIHWRKIDDKEILRIVKLTRRTAKRKDELNFQTGMFAHCHGMDFEALQLFSAAQTSQAGARPYFAKVRKSLEGLVDKQIAKAAKGGDPRSCLLALLALERSYHASLDVLQAQSTLLNKHRLSSYKAAVGKGKLIDFDDAAQLTDAFGLDRRAPSIKQEHGNGYLELQRNGVRAKWTAKGSLTFLMRAHKGKGKGQSKLEIKYGKLTAIVTISKSPAQLRVSIFSGATNESIQRSLPQGYDAWHLIEFRVTGDSLALFIDNQQLSSKPFRATDVGGKLSIKLKTSLPMDLDLIHTGK